jgi:hypothetical protein
MHFGLLDHIHNTIFSAFVQNHTGCDNGTMPYRVLQCYIII